MRVAGAAALAGILFTAAISISAHRHPVQSIPRKHEQPAAWERRSDDAFENRGLAKVERLGNRWALTVYCDGVHTTYLDKTALDPADYAADYVRARYHYVMRVGPDPRCLRAPCPTLSERLIALDRLTARKATKAEANAQSEHCSSGDERP